MRCGFGMKESISTSWWTLIKRYARICRRNRSRAYSRSKPTCAISTRYSLGSSTEPRPELGSGGRTAAQLVEVRLGSGRAAGKFLGHVADYRKLEPVAAIGLDRGKNQRREEKQRKHSPNQY